MSEEKLRAHACQWIDAWNRRDLDAVMDSYAPEVKFQAQTVVGRWKKEDGLLVGKEELRRHFACGLELAPDLRFDLLEILTGMNGVVILYRRETGALVADVVELDEEYRGVDVRAYYTQAPA